MVCVVLVDQPSNVGNVPELESHLGAVSIELAVGNIADQPGVDAIVNAANARLLPGGGVAGAIHRAAGPGLAEECRPLAPIATGEAVITGAYNLPNLYVVHCLGPVYGVDHPEDELLASCYKSSLEVADRKGVRSIAFPAISTGIFGYPMHPASKVALRTVVQAADGLSAVRTVRFVLADADAFRTYEEELRQAIEG